MSNGFIVELDSGHTLREDDFPVKEGGPSPWRRLVDFVQKTPYSIVDLRYRVGDTVIKAGSMKGSEPEAFALQYISEVEIDNDGWEQQDFVDLVTVYHTSEIHQKINLTTGEVLDPIATPPTELLAPTPKRKTATLNP